MSRLVQELSLALERLLPLGRVAPAIVAVSGGADSVALLRGMREARPDWTLFVSHVNHQLRGAESDADEEFVRDLAKEQGCEFRGVRKDVATLASADRENLEGTARKVRYEWFGELARETGAEWIATGHTADDQAETVLHRMIRGAGLRGLRGIAEERALSQPSEAPGEPPHAVRLIRPMLAVTRADVLNFLQARQQPHREDSSNSDHRFTRNRIRAELLPLLRTFNPAMVAVLGRLAEQAEDLFQESEHRAEDLAKRTELPRAGNLLIFDAEQLTREVAPLVREMFRYVWERESWPANKMTFAHWGKIAAIARGEFPATDFPNGVHVRRVGKVIQVGLR